MRCYLKNFDTREHYIMRKIGIILVCLSLTVGMYAGDVASFVNLGFSPDGKKYAFGQHGLQDKTYRAYAEIYAVDVKKNSFLPHGIFKKSPVKQTEGERSKTTFLALQNRAQAGLDRWKIAESRSGRIIFAQVEQKEPAQTLFFRDFETGNQYTVVLHVEKKAKASSAFYLTVEKTRPNGAKEKTQIGRPDYVRKGVKDYAVKKIITDAKGKALIFVIEKKMLTSSGDSFRYMVETAYLD